MHIQYVLAIVLIVSGTFTAWAGPDYGVSEDGTPFPPNEKKWVRLFGLGVLACGAMVLLATLMGFRGQPLDGQPAP